jgi:CRISPR-associated endonuclease/helicase Cas3
MTEEDLKRRVREAVDHPLWVLPNLDPRDEQDFFEDFPRRTVRRQLLDRLLLSALVDADWSHAASTQGGSPAQGREGNLRSLHEKIEGISRDDCFARILKEALTAAVREGSRRLIITLPYINMVQRMVLLCRNLFDVVESHSSPILPSLHTRGERARNRELAQTWNHSLILTTTVEFFETLSSNSTRRLRKAHNIPFSTIVVSGLHQIPYRLREASREALTTLEEDILGCHILRKSIPDRVSRNVSIRKDPIPHSDLATEVTTKNQASLVCFNRVREAQDFAALLMSLGNETYHLSSHLRLLERVLVLQRVEEALGEHRNIKLVTSPVGSHLFLPFPSYYRVFAPLDSMVSGNTEAEHILFQPDPWEADRSVYGAGAGYIAQLVEFGELTEDNIFLEGKRRELEDELEDMARCYDSFREFGEAIKADDFTKIEKQYRLVSVPHAYVVVDKGHEDTVQHLLTSLQSSSKVTRKEAEFQLRRFTASLPREHWSYGTLEDFSLWQGDYDDTLGIVLDQS